MFDPVDPRQSFPSLEHGILQYWREEDIFKRSVKSRGKHGDTFTFYDGPPFATGLPHYGHLLAGTIKDVIPRYQTMRGHRVQRRFGWDCHGLPVENLVEKEEGLKSKKDIEEKGIRWFNDKCRTSVMRYTEEWRKTVERTGRWVDMDWDYRTMDPDYMESIWWVFKRIYEKGLVYEGRKSMHVCPRCVTPLSNFEVTLGYKDVVDESVTVAFPLVESENSKHQIPSLRAGFGRQAKESQISNSKTYFLAWTTTAWTLPGNLFLAVGPDMEYVKVKIDGDDKIYVVAKNLVENVFKGKEYEVVEEVSAASLIGKEYEPLFPYFADEYKKQGAFRVVAGDFVTTEEGTGIVHVAPGFGEDDYQVGKREGVEPLIHVGMDGKFIKEITDFAGEEVRPAGDSASTDKKVAEYLKERGRLFNQNSFKHSYPHCWRCDSPLLNYSTASWFVAVEKIKDKILKQNKETNWVPSHIRDGRFGQWLEGARDWAISRNRYWGTPLPIWRCEDSVEVIGSRDELMSKCPIRFTKVTLVRHAESEGNVIPIYQGEVPGTSLTKLGIKQAKAAGKMLSGSCRKLQIPIPKLPAFALGATAGRQKNLKSQSPNSEKVSVIYSSPLARTKETAEIIAKKTGAKVIIDERLREVSFGEYEGKTIDFSDLTFVKERRAHKIEKDKPESIYHFDGMEKWGSVQERVEDFMKDVLPKHRGEHIAVVSHADPIVNMKHFFTGEDPVKLSHQPYPEKARPHTYFWDHDREAQLDLHKDTVDDLVWSSGVKDENSVEVTLVRHGETDMNKEGVVHGGKVDAPLNDKGREQSFQAAKLLKDKKYDAIISSDSKRASGTAKIISDELGIKFEEENQLFAERRQGGWAGMKRADIVKEAPTISDDINMGFHHLTAPGGETLGDFLKRGQEAYKYILDKYAGKKIILVAHRGMVQSLCAFVERLDYMEATKRKLSNAGTMTLTFNPLYRRIPDVLDCWFESGSMPYAQSHYPFESSLDTRLGTPRFARLLGATRDDMLPQGFPADFIAENLDQTRGWFYTLMVLSTALFNKPAFQNCICGGMILAEDGKKMSKRLKNYPDPNELMEKNGADALRFTLMSSPVVRAQELRFSEKPVEETLRRVILPLWNTYHFFVLHAEGAEWEPSGDASSPQQPCHPERNEAKRSGDEGRRGCCSAQHDTVVHPLDQWIKAEVQDLVNRMTEELDRYDLSATCSELYETLDALTNWYVRRSRRRFSGKEGVEAQQAALAILYDVLLTFSKLLAPFCPFVTEAIYLNLVPEDHGSIHMSDWPEVKELTSEEKELIEKTRLLRTIVSLGMGLRSEANVKVRQPLSGVEIAIPLKNANIEMRNAKKGGFAIRNSQFAFTDEDKQILAEELNVKNINLIGDASHLADRVVQVDARKAGPRFGKKVQEIIKAAKAGEFTENPDGSITVLGEKLSSEEAQITYQGKEGRNVACEKGIVVSLDSEITEELKLEGLARDVIRSIQALRKEKGLKVSDRISLEVGEGMEEIMGAHQSMIESETNGGADEKDSCLTIKIDVSDGNVVADAS